jgi:hypothetical protein
MESKRPLEVGIHLISNQDVEHMLRAWMQEMVDRSSVYSVAKKFFISPYYW